MIEDGSTGGPHGTGERPVLHAVWRWDGVGLEIAIAELPGVLILVPTLADAAARDAQADHARSSGSQTPTSTWTFARRTEDRRAVPRRASLGSAPLGEDQRRTRAMSRTMERIW